MFIDKADIIVKGGNGGHGSASFRREKFVPRGGPDGGKGGDGGDVYLEADPRLRTLLDFVRKPRHEAQAGDSGRGRNQDGKYGEDLILSVPCGTVVYQDDRAIADLTQPGTRFLVAKGGKGGRGNVYFKNSVRHAPRIAELGEPAPKIKLQLRLKVIADVGLVGFPNAGKSTLLSRLTRANPKIANYPFTTLYPNLGVALYHDREIVFADIPGLIEGSHTGKGLGHEFLKHIERTRSLVHVVDPSGFGDKSAKEGIKIINAELKTYSTALSKKPQIIAINKQDLTGAETVYKEIKRLHKKTKVLAVSGVSGAGLKELLDEVAKMIAHLPIVKQEIAQPATHINLEPAFWVERERELFVVRGKQVERLVAMTNFDLPEALERTQHILKKMGIERELLASGARAGNDVKIGKFEFTFQPEVDPSSDAGWKARKVFRGQALT